MLRAVAIWVASTGTVVAAGSFDGIYKQTPTSDCAAIGANGGSLKISSGIFTGVDMECLLARPVSVVNMDAKLFDMQCTGDGSRWTERAMIMNAADGGLIMVWNGYAFHYDRCEAGE